MGGKVAEQSFVCPHCQRPVQLRGRFCSSCGGSLAAVRYPTERDITPSAYADAGSLLLGEEEDGREVIKKICVIGDSGVGKKTVVGKIAPFNNEMIRYTETIGTAVTKYLLTYDAPPEVAQGDSAAGPMRLLVIIWDITGKEDFRHLQPSYYRGAEGLVVMVDASDKHSIEGVSEWINDAYAIIGPIPTVVVGTKVDKVDEKARRAIERQLRQLLEPHVEIPIYFVTSSSEISDLKAPFFYLSEQLRRRYLEQASSAQLRRMEQV